MELILASTSKYRAQLLERLGVPFRCIAPDVDEKAARRPEWSPEELAGTLAQRKAASVADQSLNAVVIGSDQVAECAGQVLGKPGTCDQAIAQLEFLAGRSHTLWTAIALIGPEKTAFHCNRTVLQMRRLSRAEIERYVDYDQPLDCAGSYKIESRGIALFESIESADHTAITGLPLMVLAEMLRGWGFEIP